MKAMEYKGQKVITTAMLAEAYGTSTSYISNNFPAIKVNLLRESITFISMVKNLKNLRPVILKMSG